MNGQTRTKLYAVIATRDGEYCKMCGALPWERQLILEHRDNNDANNSLENLQLMCRRCNYIKNPRRPVDLCVSEIATGEQSELDVNRTSEPLFRKYIHHRINEQTSIPEKELINSGAEHVGISPVTAKRYLDKMCSNEGIYQRRQIAKTVIVEFKKEIKLT